MIPMLESFFFFLVTALSSVISLNYACGGNTFLGHAEAANPESLSL